MSLMPLSMASPGQEVRLVEIQGGWGVRRRLADMGLTPGENLWVVQAGPSGPLVVAVRDSRLALGRGMAHKIMVEPMWEGDERPHGHGIHHRPRR
jgi:Fe2+ transport system protein FeoA